MKEKISGVYVMWDNDGNCLYVGSSLNLHHRVKTNKHRHLAARIEKYKFPQDELRDREEDFIRLLNPSLNVAKRISRPGQPSINYQEDRDSRLILDPGTGSYWTWRVGLTGISFRTEQEALNTYPLVQRVFNEDMMTLARMSTISMNGDRKEKTPTPNDLFSTRI